MSKEVSPSKEIESLKKDLNIKTQTINQYRLLISSMKKDNEQQQKDALVIDSTLKKAILEKTSLIQRNEELSKENARMKFDINRYGVELRNRFQRIKNGNIQIKKLEGELNTIKESKDHNMNNLSTKYEQQSIEDRNTINELRKIVKSKEMSLSDLSSKNEILLEEKSRFEDLSKRVREENNRLNSDNKKLTHALNHHQKTSNQQIKSITGKNISEIDRLNSVINVKDGQLEELRRESVEQEKKINDLSKRIEYISGENKKLVSSRQFEHENLIKKLSESESENTTLRNEVVRKDEQKENMKNEHEKAAEEYRNRIFEMKINMRDLEKRMNILEDQRDNLISKNFFPK